MASFEHPASLNLLQKFLQARRIDLTTSRTRNPGWYQSPLALAYQLHIRVDGPEVVTFLHDLAQNTWSPGPSLIPENLLDPERGISLAGDLIRQARAHRAQAVGVVLHLADEFAIAELKPEFDNPGALAELRATAASDPAEILGDARLSLDQFSWRIVPYPAAASEVIGTAVVVSSQYAPFLHALRQAGNDANFPVIAAAFSAPLLALSGLDAVLQPSAQKPFVAILQYPWFTVMAFFNEHADLRLLRTLPHRGARRPTNFRNTLNTTNASLEFVDPDLYLVPLGEDVDTTLAANLRVTFPTTRVETIELVADAPTWCPEPRIALKQNGEQKLLSHTFTTFREDGWGTQDFLPLPAEVQAIFPNRSDLRLLRGFARARVALTLLAIGMLAYFAWDVWQIKSRPESAYDPRLATTTQARLAKFTAERKKIEHWDNLLAGRSRAWANMEAFIRLFPEKKGILVKTHLYSAKPDTPAAGQPKVGFVKEWRITGLAREEALTLLNSLNTKEGIATYFDQVATFTRNDSFDTSVGNRSAAMTVRTSENPAFRSEPPEDAALSDESTYPYTFEVRITQRFEATDPLAIFTEKSPG